MVGIIVALIIMVLGIIAIVLGACKKSEKIKAAGIIIAVVGLIAEFVFVFVTYKNSQPQIYTTNGNAVENNYICIKAEWCETVYYTLEQYADPAVDGIKYTEPIPITGSVVVSAKSQFLFMKWSDLTVRKIVVKDGTLSISNPDEVNVPNVVGSDRATAEKALSDNDLVANVSEQYSDNVAAGIVISQTVEAGTMVDKGSTVGIVVSKGQEKVGVPNVVGVDRNSAISVLEAAGFKVSEGASQYSDRVAAGYVISQSESAGVKLAKGSTVTIVVSNGRQPFTVSFNSDGGTSVASITMKKGDTLSNENLPAPTKAYNNFSGWTYNGESVDGMTVTGDMTLTAEWSAKSTSGWVAVESIPEDAKVVDNKWTYTITTTQTTWSRGDSPLDDQGYVRTGNETWKLNGSGESFYCNGFPDGEFKNNTGLAGSVPWTASSNDIYRFDVTTDWAGYVYWHWMYDSGGTEYGQYTRNISQRSGYGTAIKNFYYKYYGEFTSTSDYQKGSSGYNNNSGWTTYVNTGRTSYADNQGTDRWFRFDYYKASFMEYYKYIEYSLTTVNSYETTTGEPGGEGVGNIVHLVRYIPK